MTKGDETLLRRWDGAKAEMFFYGAGHKEFTVRVFRDGELGQLRVLCGACLNICGPTEWNDAHLEITKERDIWVFSDRKAQFAVKCGVIGVVEDRT